MFFFQFLVQAGLFFTIPLYLSVALGLSAIDTGCGSCRCRSRCSSPPPGSPASSRTSRRGAWSRAGCSRCSPGSCRCSWPWTSTPGAEIVTVPLLLAGPRDRRAGLAAGQRHRLRRAGRPERRGRRPPEHRDQPRGLAGHRARRVPADRDAHRVVPARGSPRTPPSRRRSPRRPASSSPAGSRSSPTPTSRPRSPRPVRAPRSRQAVVDENEQARLDGLRVALAALALIALLGLFFTTRIPTRQPGSDPPTREEPAEPAQA